MSGSIEHLKGDVDIYGGIIHCPCKSRAWTVSFFNGEVTIFCIGCKRFFKFDGDSVYNESVIVRRKNDRI